MHVAIRGQCKTEDSRKRLVNESSVPRLAMDCGSHAHDTDAELVTNPVLIQKLRTAVETRQVSHEGPESRAFNCVLENIGTCGLGEVSLNEDAADTDLSKISVKLKSSGVEVFRIDRFGVDGFELNRFGLTTCEDLC